MATKSLFKTILYFLGSFTLGILLFTYGFFPLTSQSDEFSSYQDVPLFMDDILLNKTNYNRHVSKIILMVIDALKYDFINNMPFTQAVERTEKSCIFKLKIEMPSVTMPRIKSITTGSISNFIDVVMNLGSTQLLTDSIIHQMYQRGDRINFYGDNTWTNLFQNMFYRKQENFDSFYVHDFHEGDNNITMNLYSDLVDMNWDFMILHYLGLDHIGHVEGAKSPKIYDKLIEMDSVIQKISSLLDRKDTNNLSNIVIVTGDHGMRDTGGHGGGSDAEIFVPFIVFRNNCTSIKQINYNQIDIAPTIAILLGVPIPATSIGKIIPNIINFLTLEEQLFALYYNTLHLIRKAEQSLSKDQQQKYLEWYKAAKLFHKAFIKSLIKSQGSIFLFENARIQYIKTSDCISNFLVTAYTKFDLQYILLGLLLSSFGTISLVIIVLLNKRSYAFGSSVKNCSLHIIGVMFVLIIFILRIEISSTCHYLSIILIGGFIFFTIKKNYVFYRSLLQFKMNMKSSYYFVASNTFAVFTLISSSFIEEEHQLWYYIGITIFLYLSTKEFLEILKSTILKYITDYRFTDGFAKNISIFNLIKNQEMRRIIGTVTKWMMLFMIHVFIRRLNQTGDKWIHIPDIGDWFTLEKNKFYLDMFYLAGLFMCGITIRSIDRTTTKILSYTAIILIFLYQCGKDASEFFHIKQIRCNIFLFILCLNILAIIVTNYGPVLYKVATNSQNIYIQHKYIITTNVIIFILTSILLHKPYNIILIPSCIVTMKIIFESCDKYWTGLEKLMVKTILSIWIGKMFYFYQGNSNSLATIDLNSGYLFINTYNPFLVGFFVTLNTFSGPICCFLLLLREIFNDNDVKRIPEYLHFIFRLFTVLITFRLNFYLIILYIFRQHLFIWTVFSPKFLYELYELLLFIIISIINIIYFKIFKLY